MAIGQSSTPAAGQAVQSLYHSVYHPQYQCWPHPLCQRAPTDLLDPPARHGFGDIGARVGTLGLPATSPWRCPHAGARYSGGV
jgi:hypothetical protein